MLKNFKWLLAILFAIALPVVLSSCKDDDDDDDDDNNYAELIIGSWSDEGDDNWYENGGNAYGYTFRKNGICYEHGSDHGSGQYKIVKDRLTISFDGYTDTYIIEKLNERILILEEMYEDDYDYSEEVYYRVE